MNPSFSFCITQNKHPYFPLRCHCPSDKKISVQITILGVHVTSLATMLVDYTKDSSVKILLLYQPRWRLFHCYLYLKGFWVTWLPPKNMLCTCSNGKTTNIFIWIWFQVIQATFIQVCNFTYCRAKGTYGTIFQVRKVGWQMPLMILK
jgi:hypothetical protein